MKWTEERIATGKEFISSMEFIMEKSMIGLSVCGVLIILLSFLMLGFEDPVRTDLENLRRFPAALFFAFLSVCGLCTVTMFLFVTFIDHTTKK